MSQFYICSSTLIEDLIDNKNTGSDNCQSQDYCTGSMLPVRNRGPNNGLV
jgi:hypothetical protein